MFILHLAKDGDRGLEVNQIASWVTNILLAKR